MTSLWNRSRFTEPETIISCFKMSAAWCKTPEEPLILSSLHVDMTEALDFIRCYRETTGHAITVTHLCTKVLSMVLRKYPQVNAKVEGNRILRRKTVDFTLMVSMDNGHDISGIKIHEADKKSLSEIAREIRDGAELVRQNRGPTFQTSKTIVEYCSIALVKLIMKCGNLLVNKIGLNLGFLGFPDDPFGSAIISSVNKHGIESAYGPLIPIARCGLLVVIPEIQERPWVENGKLVVKPVLKLCMTFDHRVYHGFYVSQVQNEIKRLLMNPEAILEEGRRLVRGRDRLCALG